MSDDLTCHGCGHTWYYHGDNGCIVPNCSCTRASATKHSTRKMAQKQCLPVDDARLVREVVPDGSARPIRWMIFCPACKCGHGFDDRWTFNGDVEKPTFNPSMLIKSGKMPERDPKTDDYARGPDGKYLLDSNGKIRGYKDTVCHSFIEGGNIRFLDDCTHEFAGKTVPLERF